jgi:phage shock protein PspC (stress-responsive transcriptional regulator)
MPAHDDQTPLPLRAHTILGVCEAIGEDFGFSPNWVRIPLGASVLVSPMMAVAAYLALGAVVLASRLLFPKAKVAASVGAEANAQEVPANDPAKQDELSIAA